MRIALFLLAAACSSLALAHSVQHHVATATGAAVITLSYANGKPFAHEKYSLQAAGSTRPDLTGHTDADGRIVFLPGATDNWHLKAMATHGHGLAIDLHLPPAQPVPPPATPPDPPTTPASPVQPAPAESGQPSQASLALFGLSLLFGGFGAYQLFLRRRRS